MLHTHLELKLNKNLKTFVMAVADFLLASLFPNKFALQALLSSNFSPSFVARVYAQVL